MIDIRTIIFQNWRRLLTSLASPALTQREGGKMKVSNFYRNWPVHNLIGHPLLEVLTWIGLGRLGKKIHDVTLPDHVDD